MPVTGVLAGTALLGLATTSFPGGNRWSEHTISALFQAATPVGLVNPARPLAVMGVLAAMSGVALLFHVISSQAGSAFHKKAIRINGVSSTAFATLTVTLLHDLMVGLALISFLVALSAMLHMLLHATRARPVCAGRSVRGD